MPREYTAEANLSQTTPLFTALRASPTHSEAKFDMLTLVNFSGNLIAVGFTPTIGRESV